MQHTYLASRWEWGRSMRKQNEYVVPGLRLRVQHNDIIFKVRDYFVAILHLSLFFNLHVWVRPRALHPTQTYREWRKLF